MDSIYKIFEQFFKVLSSENTFAVSLYPLKINMNGLRI